MRKPAKAEIMREVKDYIYITLGLISYALGWAAFLLPYQITTGGTTGIGAIIYYATGFPIQWSYFSKCFKNQFGVSPSAYRKKLSEDENEPINDADV